jgi:hypothetical protein
MIAAKQMGLLEATDLLLDLEGIYGGEEAAKEMFIDLVLKEYIQEKDAKELYFRAKNGIFYGKQKEARIQKYQELFRSVVNASK